MRDQSKDDNQRITLRRVSGESSNSLKAFGHLEDLVLLKPNHVGGTGGAATVELAAAN